MLTDAIHKWREQAFAVLVLDAYRMIIPRELCWIQCMQPFTLHPLSMQKALFIASLADQKAVEAFSAHHSFSIAHMDAPDADRSETSNQAADESEVEKFLYARTPHCIALAILDGLHELRWYTASSLNFG